VEVTAALTIWILFSCFLLFPHLGLPAVMHRTAMALLVAEFIALMTWSYGTPGSPSAEAARSVVAIDVPLLAAVLILAAVLLGLRSHRAARRRTRVR